MYKSAIQGQLTEVFFQYLAIDRKEVYFSLEILQSICA
jgi:hypothetical protein